MLETNSPEVIDTSPDTKKDEKKEATDFSHGATDFSCEYSDNLPQILKQLNISLAFTSYQAGRLMLVRTDGVDIDINYKAFARPMGLSVSETGLTLGTFTQVINFQRADNLVDTLKKPLTPIEDDITAPRLHLKEGDKAQKTEAPLPDTLTEEERLEREEMIAAMRRYEEQQHQPVDARVDACFIPRSVHYSGMINIHDIAWGNEGLWAVNSSFSCLCTLSPDYSFVPQWKPYFISELVPEDRCHLNGMTLKDGEPAYVSTFSRYNSAGQWRQGEKFNGTLMDVENNAIILEGLAMPHSPRWHQDWLYYCNSGCGEFSRINPSTGQNETLVELQGFTRGVDFYGDIAFVGTSKVRAGNVLNAPPLAQKYSDTFSGIWLIDTANNRKIGYIKFTGNVEQIYDVAIISGSTFPEILEPNNPRVRNHFLIP